MHEVMLIFIREGEERCVTTVIQQECHRCC